MLEDYDIKYNCFEDLSNLTATEVTQVLERFVDDRGDEVEERGWICFASVVFYVL